MKTRTMKKISTFVLMLVMMLSVIPVVEQVSAASKPAKPKISVEVADDSSSATITIGKTKKAQGFQVVAQFPGADEFTELATLEVDGKEKRSYTLENVPSGDYSVKVRAYTVKNGNKVWGKYSKVKTLTIVNMDSSVDLGIEWGDIIQLGSFEQDGNLENGAEPIDWIVLSIEDGKLFLISEYVLAPGSIDNGAYGYNRNKKWVGSWSQSGMREWLNGEFLSDSFTEAEAAIIADTELEEEGCTDKIFLLSRTEIKNKEYDFEYNSDRVSAPTYYATHYPKGESVWTWDGGNLYEINGKPACYWWLRTVNPDDKEFYLVNDDGTVGKSTSDGIDYYAAHSDEDEEYYIEEGGIGIRPAMVINATTAAKNVIVKTGKTWEEEWKTVEWAEDDYDDEYEDADERYVDIPTREVRKIKNANVGDLVEFGTYEQDNNPENGKEPIKWIVLEKSGKNLFIMSLKALDCKLYNKKSKNDLKWENSSIRKWLNGDFYKNAFSASEKKKIQTIKNDNLVASPSEEAARISEDKVFLLSEDEMSSEYMGLTDMGVRACVPTAYARAAGVYDEGEIWDKETYEYIIYCAEDEDDPETETEVEVCRWWLRTRKDDKVLVCDLDGRIKKCDMDYKKIGVRPVMVISSK